MKPEAARRVIVDVLAAFLNGRVDAPEAAAVSGCITMVRMPERFDLDLLDDEDPFEIDAQAAHLFKHPRLGIEDVMEAWQSDPLFYPAKPPAHG